MDYRIPFFMHDLGEAELESLREVLQGPILTTGETVARFEQGFAEYLGAQQVLATNSCTGALHIALEALGIGPGDEVITTPLTFIATSTAILHAGATPVFVDVEADTGNLDAGRIAAAITPRTRAILPVHLYGQMCDMRAIRALAEQHGLKVVEDCAHCIEGERDGVRPAMLSDAAAFSFFATKNITCGEGGALAFNDETLNRPLRRLALHGMDKSAADRHREGYSHWDMVSYGWKYNLSNVQAALLLPQLPRIASNHAKREALASRYIAGLSGIEGVLVPPTRPGVRHARHLFPIRVAATRRDELIQHLLAHGVGVVVNYRAIHRLSFFRERFGFVGGEFPLAEAFGDEVLSLPFYPTMPEAHVDRVVELIQRFFSQR